MALIKHQATMLSKRLKSLRHANASPRRQLQVRPPKVVLVKVISNRKNRKSINLKRILEKTPESTPMLRKDRRVPELVEVRNVKEVAVTRNEVVELDVVVVERTMTWSTGPRLRLLMPKMLLMKMVMNKKHRLMLLSTKFSRLRNRTRLTRRMATVPMPRLTTTSKISQLPSLTPPLPNLPMSLLLRLTLPPLVV